jgi:hypothetical protein
VDDQLVFEVTVRNKAGHKLPTAYPSRRVWLRIEVRDSAGKLCFASGSFDRQGRLTDMAGAVLPSELPGGPTMPHMRDVVRDTQVPIYESVMADETGLATYTLLRGATYLKDNRVLPRGWSGSHVDAANTRPAGVLEDNDFVGGQDRVHYAVPVSGQGPWRIDTWLHYQVLGARFAGELFRFDTPEVALLRSLYEGVDPLPETLATASWQGP